MNLQYLKPLLTRTGNVWLILLSIGLFAGTSYADNTEKLMPWELTDNTHSHNVTRYQIMTSELSSDLLHSSDEGYEEGYDEEIKEAYVVIDATSANSENPVKKFYLHLIYAGEVSKADNHEVAFYIGDCQPSPSSVHGKTELICYKADMSEELAQNNVLLAGDVLKKAEITAVMMPCYQQGKMDTLSSYHLNDPYKPFVETLEHNESTPVLHSFALTMEFQGADTSLITAFDPVSYRQIGAACHDAYGNDIAF